MNADVDQWDEIADEHNAADLEEQPAVEFKGKQIDPDAYEAVHELTYAVQVFLGAKIPSEWANAIERMSNAVSDAESWLREEDQYDNLPDA